MKVNDIWDSNLNFKTIMLMCAITNLALKAGSDTVEISTKELMKKLNMTEVQVRRARNLLLENGYIKVEKGINKTKLTKYTIL